MLRGAPARPQLVVDLVGRLGEGGSRLVAPLLRQGIAALPGQLPVREGLLPGFLQRDQGETAESELGPAPADGKALDPAPAARGTHHEIEALAVTIASGPAHATDKEGRERVVGMLAGGLALRGAFGKRHTHHYTPRNMRDARVWRGTLGE